MRRLAPLALALTALALTGCGGGPRVTVERDVAAFDRLEVADSIDVEVVPGTGGVQVHAGRDVMDRIETRSDGGVLRLDVIDRGIVIGPDPLGDVRVTVAASHLQGVTVSGAGDVALAGIDSERFELSVEGSGEVEASGRAQHLAATVEGAGDARLGKLAATTAEVSVQGAGEASVRRQRQARRRGARGRRRDLQRRPGGQLGHRGRRRAAAARPPLTTTTRADARVVGQAMLEVPTQPRAAT